MKKIERKIKGEGERTNTHSERDAVRKRDRERPKYREKEDIEKTGRQTERVKEER